MNEIERYIRERHTPSATSTAALISAVQSLTLFSDLGATKYTTDRMNQQANKHLCLPWAAYENEYCQWRHMQWQDQLAFARLVVNEQTNLEALRIAQEKYIAEVRFAPPPVVRQTLPSRGKAVMFGGGVTKVEKYSDKINDEKANDNGKLAFLAKGESITAKFFIPDNLTAIFIATLKEEEVRIVNMLSCVTGVRACAVIVYVHACETLI